MTTPTVGKAAVQPLSPPLLEKAVGIQPRAYQKDGIAWLFGKKRAMLTDAPGLGKTPQGALAAVPPAIVVCPNYLVGQWEDWLHEHLPSCKVAACTGGRWEKYATIFEASRIDPKTGAQLPGTPVDFLIVNKEMMRTHLFELAAVCEAGVYNTIIVDESHHFRNRNAEQSKGLFKLSRMVSRFYELTATPIWREFDDLFMQLRFLAPTVFTSYNEFVELYGIYDDDRYGRKVYGVKPEMLPELDAVLSVLRFGRNYEQASRELPPVMDETVYIQFDKQMRSFYDDALNNYRVKFADDGGKDLFLNSMSEVMHTLRQFCSWPGKIETIKAILEDTAPYDHGRAVIFCWYRDTAEKIGAALPGSQVITGAITDAAERRRLAAAASTSGAPIVATLSSLSEGVDVSWARHVIFAEEHYAPGSHVQSMARVVRERQIDEESTGIPQASDDPWDIVLKDLDARRVNAAPVLVHYVVVKDSIDEIIHKTSRRRGDTMRSILQEAVGF